MEAYIEGPSTTVLGQDHPLRALSLGRVELDDVRDFVALAKFQVCSTRTDERLEQLSVSSLDGLGSSRGEADEGTDTVDLGDLGPVVDGRSGSDELAGEEGRDGVGCEVGRGGDRGWAGEVRRGGEVGERGEGARGDEGRRVELDEAVGGLFDEGSGPEGRTTVPPEPEKTAR